MAIDRYYTLGRTGLRVSRISLGTMTFGKEWGWGADEESSRAMFNRYLDAGGNFIDTADLYTQGTSETILGRFIAERKARDQVVLATKFTHNQQPGNPNAGGNGRKNMVRALDASLKRLGTDYVDLYIMHNWDVLTPAEEVIRSLDDLVRSGRVRHVGLSDVPAWYAATMQTVAEFRGYEPVSSIQLEYSLIERNIEFEHVPLGLAKGMGITAWSPLAGGILSGKYKAGQADLQGQGRLGKLQASVPKSADHKKKSVASRTLSRLNERSFAILAELETAAAQTGRSMAQVALNWVAHRPCVASVIVGASRVEQLDENLAALDFELPAELSARLDEASRPQPHFPYELFGGDLQKMMRGGKTVAAKPPGYLRDELADSGNT
jgi:aryl-alcohol dehydrogenase-like predicted oxidoreductase